MGRWMKNVLFSALICVVSALPLVLSGCSDVRTSPDSEIALENGIAAYQSFSAEEAAHWFKLSAEQGNAKSKTFLGLLYFSGEGVQRDHAEGLRWIKLAADQGDPDGQFWYGFIRLTAEEGPQASNDEAERQRLLFDALGWWKLAADQGHGQAMVQLGEMYWVCRPVDDCEDAILQVFEEVAVPKDVESAEHMFKKAAELGDASGLVSLGKRYWLGNDVPENATEAVRLYKIAAGYGHADGQRLLGDMYRWGEGVTKNDKEALRLYRLAAESGDVYAQTTLADMHLNGQGVPKNGDEAVRWYTRAADQGGVGAIQAQYTLAVMYSNGDGVPKDYVQAYKWYNILGAMPYSSATGYQDNRERLARKMTPDQIAEAQRLSSDWKPNLDRNRVLFQVLK